MFFTERYFFLALNGSRQDEADYLVWVETDKEGRILGRGLGGNWGKADKREYLKRFQNNESFRRDDGSVIIVREIGDDYVVIERETTKHEVHEAIFNVRKPWLKPEEPPNSENKDHCNEEKKEPLVEEEQKSSVLTNLLEELEKLSANDNANSVVEPDQQQLDKKGNESDQEPLVESEEKPSVETPTVQ